MTLEKKAHIDNLSDFTRDVRILILSALAIVVGILSAFVAWGLVWLISLFTNIAFFQRFSGAPASPAAHHLGSWMILVPVIGGVIIGLMARYGSEKIRGHGIPEALEAILFGRSRMQPRVALLKPLSSAISIGTGGPFGAEGPIIMTGGAVGSLFAQFFHLSPAERKTLLVAGAAGGMSAIFFTPVAAVLLAVELLLFEWKPRSFIPVAIASTVAGAMRVFLLGNGPIFGVPAHPILGAQILVICVGIGVLTGLASGLLTGLVYFFEDLFARLPIHWMWWPAIGGLFVGIGGLINPHVLGVGYDVIHNLLRGQLVGYALITLLIVKCLIWAIALGSGTSGGVLAPLLIMGGALGALLSGVLHLGDPGLWAMISMSAMMGGTMRSPITAIIFTLELTHDVNVLPALMVGTVAAHMVTVLLLRRSILTEKVARRGYHVTREYTVDPLSQVRVTEVMDSEPQTVPAMMPASSLLDLIGKGDASVSRHQALPIIDAGGNLAGMVTRGDLLRALTPGARVDLTVIEAGTDELVVTYPDELLAEAVIKMLKNDIGRLPVVDRHSPRKLVGYLGRAAVMAATLRRYEEEHVRDRGWFLTTKEA